MVYIDIKILFMKKSTDLINLMLTLVGEFRVIQDTFKQGCHTLKIVRKLKKRFGKRLVING